MATESVSIDQSVDANEAITEWCIDIEWDEMAQNLPVGVLNRLKIAHRSLYALNCIQNMLFSDRLGKLDRDDTGATFEGLKGIDVEGLMVAALELGSRSERMLDEVKEGKWIPAGTVRKLGRKQ